MPYKLKISCFLIAIFTYSCTKQAEVLPNEPVYRSYLALGDSYTIGQGVALSEAFPNQLVEKLRAAGKYLRYPEILARTGWTTGELAAAMADYAFEQVRYDFVTLLIGVNNQFRGLSTEQYRQEFESLLDAAIRLTDGKTERIIVLSIPDYSVTPFGRATRNAEQTAREIDQFNAIKEESCKKKGISFIDVTGISRMAAVQPDLLAVDGLHPSGKMYGLWVEKIIPTILQRW